MPVFKIDSIFQITGRGQVIAGSILNGEINAGDFIEVLLDKNLVRLKIKSVEAILGARDLSKISLLMEPLDKDSINLNHIIGQTAIIIKT